MRYAIKISNAGRRYDGEYDAGQTLDAARKEGKQFASYVKVERPDSRIRIVKFLKDDKSPEGVRVKTVEEVTLSSRDAERRRHRQKATSRKQSRDASSYHRELAAIATRQGWRVETTEKGHWRFIPPDKTKRIVILPGTSVSRVGMRNSVAELRRNGLVVARDASRRLGPRGGQYMTPAKRKKVSDKIRLLREEGYPRNQAVAIAMSMYNVPRPNRPVKHLTPSERRQSARARRRGR